MKAFIGFMMVLSLLAPANFSLADGWTTGNELAEQCRNAAALIEDKPAEVDQAGMCLGFLRGVLEATMLRDKLAGGDTLASMPAGVTTYQSLKIVTKYMNEHPESLNLPASAIVLEAILTAWPPKK